jgi:uncharacterized DUF497 family protein
MNEVRFTWDTAKAESSRRKHGVDFEDALAVFRDPLHLSRLDRIEGGEQRWQTIGRAHGVTVLLVVHTMTEEGPEPVEVIRIISARKATRSERKRYEEQDR